MKYNSDVIKRYGDDTFCDERSCEKCDGCADSKEYFEINLEKNYVNISYTNKTAGIDRVIVLDIEEFKKIFK